MLVGTTSVCEKGKITDMSDRNNRKKWQKSLLCIGLSVLLLLGGITGVAAAEAKNSLGASSRSAVPPIPREVYVGGMPFGVKFYTEGVTVVGYCDVEANGGQSSTCNPAREAGIQIKDRITHVGGQPIADAAALTAAVEASGGRPLDLTVCRTVPKRTASGVHPEQVEIQAVVTPVFSEAEQRYKTGIWVRDSGAGIGTVTFVLPASNAFAGLGHGICDNDTGELIPMQRGVVSDVTISSVEKGLSGDPGALKGYFNPGKTGTLLGNTDCGVFGVFAAPPAGLDSRLVPVATRNEIKEGPATVRCTLDSGKIQEYAVTISAIDRDAQGPKCFTVKVTDPALLEKTGGIVQGMSGSPIIQNGKLVGAVTHVLINDPTTGYGIFIENMFHAARRNLPSLQQKAA